MSETRAMANELAKSHTKRYAPSRPAMMRASAPGSAATCRGSQKGNCDEKSVREERSIPPKKTRPCGESKECAMFEIVPLDANSRGSSLCLSASPPSVIIIDSRSACVAIARVGRTARAARRMAAQTETAEVRWWKRIRLSRLRAGVDVAGAAGAGAGGAGVLRERDGEAERRRAPIHPRPFHFTVE